MIKYYGFEYPPVGTIDLLNKLGPSDALFYILDPFTGHELPYEEIKNASKSNLYVIITTNEGASHHWFDRLIDKLVNVCKLSPNHIILHSSCLLDEHTPIKHVSSIVGDVTDFFSYYPPVVDVKAYPTKYHFVCLNRQPRWQRLELVKMLIDRDLCKHGIVSYVSRLPASDPYHKWFPMLVDRKNVSIDQGFEIPDQLSQSLFNILTESCYEKQSSKDQFESHPCPGITEKTYKCILLGQIPIFVAPYLTVQCYRELGFDAFDDIIDHGYDLERDPKKRLVQIVEQVQQIVQLKNIENLRAELMPRFQNNLEILKSYNNNRWVEAPQWKLLFSCNNQN
jgi:hypothetical protein